jgi:DNA-binding MarR family transcriptional regulator
VLDFLRILWSLDHGLQSFSKRMEIVLGVTGPQRLALRVVGRFPGISAGGIAELMSVHPSTLTGILRRLVDRGFLARRSDVSDRRRALFRLTARGKRLDALRTGTVENLVGRVLRRASESDVNAAARVLGRIAEELRAEIR